MMLLTEIIASDISGGLLAHYSDITEVPTNARFIFIIVSKMLFFLLVELVTHFFANAKDAPAFHTKHNTTLIFVCSFTCAISFVLFYICTSNDLNSLSERLMSIISIMLLATNIYFAWLFDYNEKQQDEITNLKLNAQRAEDALQYSDLIEQQDENQKILIHDIKNHLLTIHDLNKGKQYEQTNKYIQDLLGSSALSRIHKPTSCHLFNLLMARYGSICNEKAIDFVLDAKDADLRSLDAEDITSLFCNLMDNAIDAATGTKTPKIELRLSGNDYRSHTVITMINSCDKEPVQTASNKFLTQKSNKQFHGFGTRSIERVVKKYGGDIEMYYQQDEQEFHTILLLKNDNKSASNTVK